MKVLISGFRGDTNSAKLIIDRIESRNVLEKIYLVNSFETSKNQLESELEKKVYDYIIIFGQKPKVKAIYLEQRACVKGHKLTTNFEYTQLESILNENGLKAEISNNAGNYLCNYIFYRGLKFINENNLNTKMIFVHIPSVKNIESIDSLAKVFSVFINMLV
jgi:pyroglutamyl-peptidase